jgi:hypothetical protein
VERLFNRLIKKYMHSHNGKNNKSMMWMMIPCLLLVVVVLFSGGKLGSSNYLWLIMLGVCVVPHLWMMFKGHGGHGDNNTEDKINDASTKEPETKDGNEKSKHGGCCH